MTEKQIITEEMGVHKEWYVTAKAMSQENLIEFIRHITEDYEHDYGTICHAIAAASIAAAWTVERSPQGGITGFQAGAIMWEFCRHWQSWGDEPRRMIDYGNLLYPQYENSFRRIRPETWEWTQKKAAENLASDSGVSPVREHWQSIVDGVVPFGLTVGETS